MLTLDEIRNVTFEKAMFGGYSAEQVDDFIEKVIETTEYLIKKADGQGISEPSAVEPVQSRSEEDSQMRARAEALLESNSALASEKSRLEQQNADLTAKLKVLADEIQRMRNSQEDISRYRALEENMKEVMFSSQKAAAGIIDNAKQRAAEIVSEAEQKRNEIDKETRQLSESRMSELNKALENENKRLETLRASNDDTIKKVKSFYYAKLHELAELLGEEVPDTGDPAELKFSPIVSGMTVESREETVSD